MGFKKTLEEDLFLVCCTKSKLLAGYINTISNYNIKEDKYFHSS